MEISMMSFVLFQSSRCVLNGFLVPSLIRSQGRVTTWKFTNTVNSLIHSFVTGFGAILCFYFYPETAKDMISAYSILSYRLTAFSVGYFLYDFLDMFLNHRKRSSYELMVHHTFVISCFGTSLLSNLYLGFAMVALLIETNSIFLHWRQLLILSHTPKASTYYRTISLLNLFTFVAFRIVTLGWMTRWLALNRDNVALPAYTLGCIAMAVLVTMSIVLFIRVLKADYFKQSCHNTSGGSSINSGSINSNNASNNNFSNNSRKLL